MGPSGRFTHVMIYWTVWDKFMQVLYLGRVPRTKETLPDFLKWRRVTRHPLVFRGLTGSQRTPGFWGVTLHLSFSLIFEILWTNSLFSNEGISILLEVISIFKAFSLRLRP